MPSPLAQAMAYQNSVQPYQSPISPADVLGAYKLSSDVAEKNYQAKLAAMQGLWGGLASLGAAGLIGFGPSAAKKYFGTAATPASNAAGSTAPTVTSGVDATGSPVAASSTSWSAPVGAAEGTSDAVAPSIFDMAAPAEYSIGDIAPSVAPSIAADYGLTDAGASGLGALGADAAGAAGSIAADMGAGAAGAGADAAAMSIPDFLASFLPFL